MSTIFNHLKECIAAAKQSVDLRLVKDTVRMSDQLSDAEKTLLFTAAEERQQEIHNEYLAAHVYHPGHYAGD